MEILYVIGMIAVFVLCLALLSTARRILRAAPVSIRQVASTRIDDLEQLEDGTLTEISSARIIPSVESARFESTLVIDEPFLLEIDAPAVQVAPVTAAEPTPLWAQDWIEDNEQQEDFEQPQKSKWTWLPKPTRQTYNYALECVLLGVSAWVLIKTQQDAMRDRSTQASRHRVA